MAPLALMRPNSLSYHRRKGYLNSQFHIASSPELGNRTYSFGTVGSSRGYIDHFLHLNNWKSIAIFYEEGSLFQQATYAPLVNKSEVSGRIKFSTPISKT